MGAKYLFNRLKFDQTLKLRVHFLSICMCLNMVELQDHLLSWLAVAMVVYPCYQCLPQIAASNANCTPPSRVRKEWEEFSQVTRGERFMTATGLAEFMRNVQGENDVTEEDAVERMAELLLATRSSNDSHYSNSSLRGSTHSSQQNLVSEPPNGGLDLPTFLKFLLNPDLNGPISPASQTVSVFFQTIHLKTQVDVESVLMMDTNLNFRVVVCIFNDSFHLTSMRLLSQPLGLPTK